MAHLSCPVALITGARRGSGDALSSEGDDSKLNVETLCAEIPNRCSASINLAKAEDRGNTAKNARDISFRAEQLPPPPEPPPRARGASLLAGRRSNGRYIDRRVFHELDFDCSGHAETLMVACGMGAWAGSLSIRSIRSCTRCIKASWEEIRKCARLGNAR